MTKMTAPDRPAASPVQEPGLRELLRGRKLPTVPVDFLTATDDVIPITFSAIPAYVYEDLLREHPPEPGDRTPWRARGFVPAVLGAGAVDEQLDVEFWAAYTAGATTKTVADLIDVITTLNGMSAVRWP